jgi:hypothetical protein
MLVLWDYLVFKVSKVQQETKDHKVRKVIKVTQELWDCPEFKDQQVHKDSKV